MTDIAMYNASPDGLLKYRIDILEDEFHNLEAKRVKLGTTIDQVEVAIAVTKKRIETFKEALEKLGG